MNLLLPFAEEQLDLRLCFFNFESGTKVSLTFDLSCLKRLVLFSFSFNDLFHFKVTYCESVIDVSTIASYDRTSPLPSTLGIRNITNISMKLVATSFSL